MRTAWKHVYDLREGDLVRVGPNGQLFFRVNNPLNPHEEVCAVVVDMPKAAPAPMVIDIPRDGYAQ